MRVQIDLSSRVPRPPHTRRPARGNALRYCSPAGRPSRSSWSRTMADPLRQTLARSPRRSRALAHRRAVAQYAHELDDMEAVWRDLKAHHLTHQTCTDDDALDQAIHAAVQDLNRMVVPLDKSCISASGTRRANASSVGTGTVSTCSLRTVSGRCEARRPLRPASSPRFRGPTRKP